MKGGSESTASRLGMWALVDNKSKAEMLNRSQNNSDEKDQNGRYKWSQELSTNGMTEVPEEFTLQLLSVTRYNELQHKWKLPLY
ncbi:MAG TPA: hypothetical protein VGI33_04205 [Paenibacillus sp.]|jgi:hypothetical protein